MKAATRRRPIATQLANDHAADVGRKVLAGLDKGRQRAIAQAQARSRGHARVILSLAAADIAAGGVRRGRAGRIARKLGGRLSASQVRRILRTLSSLRDAVRYAPRETTHLPGGGHGP
jgi:hypothetical protein